MKRVVSTDGKEHFEIRFDYEPSLVAAVKALPGRKYEAVGRYWRVPGSSADRVLEFATKLGFEMTIDAGRLVEVRQKTIEQSSAFESNFEVEGLGGTLRPFQKAGVEYILKSKRCFVADEMGLGKTVEALAALEAANAFPALVVCPASLKLNWKREADKWLPQRTNSVMSGDGAKADITIINYDVLKKFEAELLERRFKAVIYDESHMVKNSKARRTKLATKLAKGVPYRLCLTGTPVLNRPNELLSQLSLLGRLDEFGGFWEFAKRYCGARHTRWGWDFSGASNLDELNERMRASCYIRRRKQDVLKELPNKVRTVIPVSITNRAEYQRAETALIQYLKEVQGITDEQARNKMRAEQLVKIEVTKQVAVRGKMKAMTEWIDSFLETGEKLVIFAHHQAVVHEFAQHYKAPYITGETSVKTRQTAVDQFQHDKNCRILVCNIQTGGLGLTLTAASNVVFTELGWTPAVHNQAEDRCHRMGQSDSVNAWYFLAENTIDEVIYNLIETKRGVVDAVIESDREAQISVLDELVKTLTGESKSSFSPTKVNQAIEETPSTLAVPLPSIPAPQISPVDPDVELAVSTLKEDDWIKQSLVTLYRLQTTDEQLGQGTIYRNNRGFNAFDANFGSSLAKQVLAGKDLSRKQLVAAKQLLRKYKRQLAAQELVLH